MLVALEVRPGEIAGDVHLQLPPEDQNGHEDAWMLLQMRGCCCSCVDAFCGHQHFFSRMIFF